MVVKTLTPAYGGFAIAREEKVIFVRGAIPGELVDTEIEEKKRDYIVASVTQVIEPSEHRVEPPCPVFGVCGGCHLQFATYEKQVSMKEEVLLESLVRLGGIEAALGPSLVGAQWNYRYRAQFKIGRQGEIGFFRKASRDVIGIESCPLLDDRINSVLAQVRDPALLQGFTDLHVICGEQASAFLRGNGDSAAAAARLMAAGCAGVVCSDGSSAGEPLSVLDLNGIRYGVSPATFFQAHWDLNRRMVEFLIEQLRPLEGLKILDLYAGAGNFALPLALQGADVTAVEENAGAVADGIRNAKDNNIKKCRFRTSTAEKFNLAQQFDAVIIDPPRPGLTNEVRKRILDQPARKLAYLSCNPSTLARDLKQLKTKYDLESVRLVDLFPNTYHIEALAVLRLR